MRPPDPGPGSAVSCGVSGGKARMQIRKNPRLPGYDYSRDGIYFVTICTAGRQCLFGTIRPAVGGDAHIAPHMAEPPAAVNLTSLGRVVEKYLHSMPGVERYVVMPDHVHILVRIAGRPMRASAPTVSLPKLVRSFKGLCTKAAGRSIWQRGYYDHIIRDENDFLRCWKYLDENPASWQERYLSGTGKPQSGQGGKL